MTAFDGRSDLWYNVKRKEVPNKMNGQPNRILEAKSMLKRGLLSIGAGIALAAAMVTGPALAGPWRGGGQSRAVITVSPSTNAVVRTTSTNTAVRTTAANSAAVVRSGAYYSKEQVAAYLRAFGTLPSNFITKAEARRLGWQGGPVEPYAPGKAIGGDRFGNYERKLPYGRYRECDIDTKGRPRGAKRLIFSDDRRIYYTGDHYQTFQKVP